MISVEDLRMAIREGRLTPEEKVDPYRALAQIAWRLWYEDPQILEAMHCADEMERQRRALSPDVSALHGEEK